MEATTLAPISARLTSGSKLLADAAAIVGVTVLAVALRLVRVGLFASGTSTDEYRYAIIAQEWLRILGGQSAMTLQSLAVHHPLVPVIAGVVSSLSGTDPLSAGRAVQLALNAGTVPLLYLLARTAGLQVAAATMAATALAVVRGFWETSASFLPDSQLALLSTLALLGTALSLRGREWGSWLAAAALGCGFLTKEHLPLVLLPALATIYLASFATGLMGIRMVVQSLGVIVVGLLVAVLVGALGLGVPRPLVLALVGRQAASATLDDSLPAPAPSLEADTGGSWIASLIGALVNRDVSLDWFGDAFGIQVLNGGVVILGLVGAAALLRARSPFDRDGRDGRLLPWARLACLAVPIAVFVGQIVARRAWDALFVAVACLGGLLLVGSGRFGLPSIENDWLRTGVKPADRGAFWSVLAGCSVYLLATLGFFALKLESVSFLPRMFLPVMPVSALFFGIGCVAVGRAIRPFAERISSAALVALGGTVLAALLPGQPLLKAGAAMAACAGGAGLHWSGLGRRLPRTETIVIFAGLASLILGASASYAVARASEFRGSSNDANVPILSGNLRVATFAAAEPWLQSNLRPTEIVITSKPYQVGWHAALGFTGYQSMRVWDERALDRRRYLSDEVLQSGPYDWIVDFNQFAAQPESPEGPAFEIDYGWLQSRSYLHEAYTASDQQGRVLLYAFRHERS